MVNIYKGSPFIHSHGQKLLPISDLHTTTMQGTDITESFEVHHIHTERVEPVLAKFYIRDAKQPRNIKLTFHENGFYRTLKRRIADKLQTIDRRPERHTKVSTGKCVFVAIDGA